MGETLDINCCQRPTNLDKKNLKTYRGIKQKDIPKLPSSSSDEPDNFGTIIAPKNLENKNKREGSYMTSVYANLNDKKFPDFSNFDIEPVAETQYSNQPPITDENISTPQYGNAQYNGVYSTVPQQNPTFEISQQNPVIQTPQQNPIIQISHQNPEIQTNYSENIDTTNQYSHTQNGFQLGKIETNSNYIENNYATYKTNEYIKNTPIESQSLNYINSNSNNNIVNIESNQEQYYNSQNILPTKYIVTQKPIIYENNNSFTPVPEYTQSYQTKYKYEEPKPIQQQYEQYNYADISSNQYIESKVTPIQTINTPKYYESNNNNNNITYLPQKTEIIYNPPTSYTDQIPNIESNEVQYSQYPSQYINSNIQPTSYYEQPQQIYNIQNPEIYKETAILERRQYIQPQNKFIENDDQDFQLTPDNVDLSENYNNQKPVIKAPKDCRNKKKKKGRKKKKAHKNYSEEEEEEEEEEKEEEEEEEENEDPSSSYYEEIKRKKKAKAKTNKHKKNKEEEHKSKRNKEKKIYKPKIRTDEDKENESDNIDIGKNIKNKTKNKNIKPNNKIEKEEESNIIEKEEEEEEEFSGFQKEPKLVPAPIDNSNIKNEIEDSEDIFPQDKNKINVKKIISLKDGSKIEGNFVSEKIEEDRKDIAEKERTDLFCGKTLKTASVEKKQENTGCQVPQFISNIYNKFFD